MKKVIITLSILTILTVSIHSYRFVAFAATSTPSAVSTPSAKPESKVQDLLDRVSDKVTKLTEKMQRTYHGPIKSISTTTITLTTSEGSKNVITNDATDFFRIKAGKQSTTDLKGLKSGDDISVIGTIDPQTTDMTAKQIVAKIHRSNFSGTIQNVEDTIATITLPDNSTVKVDLDGTKLEKVSSGKIIPAKLSDFVENSTIFAIAFSPDSKTGVYSSLKALALNK